MGDTEWDDILIKYGIKDPPKKLQDNDNVVINKNINKEVKAEDLDDEDDDLMREYRNRRMAEMRAEALLPRFADVREITASDYVQQVNEAGLDVWVVLVLYERGIIDCSVILQLIDELAKKYPNTKFLKSIASLCIPNFPESSLPAVFIYQNGCLKKQLIGSQTFGGTKASLEILEWLISKSGAISSNIQSDPRIVKQSKKFYKHYEDNDV